MVRLIAIALLLVRHPAERAEIAHPHPHRLAGLWHARNVKRRRPEPQEHFVAQALLLFQAEQARIEAKALKIGGGTHLPNPAANSVSFLFRRAQGWPPRGLFPCGKCG
jgi:hypothetical protein